MPFAVKNQKTQCLQSPPHPLYNTCMPNKTKLIRFDWAMKTILRNKANFDILEGFLSALLKIDITIEEILESESNQEDEKQKFNRVDLLVKDTDDRRFIIEVQAETESDYLERLLFGTCKTIVENLQLGDRYHNIKKVISVSIMYFNLGKGSDYLYHGKTEFKGMHTGEILEVRQKKAIQNPDSPIVRMVDGGIALYPEYYLIEVERFGNSVKEAIDEWIYFLKNEEIKDEFKSRNIQQAKNKLDLLKMNESERRAYEKYVMNLISERDAFETVHDKGREEGRKEGREEGIQETEERIARNMKTGGMTVEQIQKMTGLEQDVIEKL